MVAHGVVTMLMSLAVDILMRSQEKARVFREVDTNDARSSSMVVQDVAGSLQQIPVRKECPEGLNRVGMVEAPEAAMSSDSSIMSGFVGPVGRRLHRQLCVICLGCTPWGICSAGSSP